MKYLIALLLTTTIAHAECQTPDDIKTSIRIAMPTATIAELGELGTQLFLLKFNAFEPVSNHRADMILVADKPSAPRMAIIYFIKGCYVESSFPERQIYNDIMGKPL